MTENSQLLEDAEREVARLIEQAEQEKAMAAVLPARFKSNMAIFEELMPEIAKNFKNYKPTRDFRFFCNENGIPNILWLDDNSALYGHDPYKECFEQISDIVKNTEILRLNLNVEKNLFNQMHVTYLNRLASLYMRAEKENETKVGLGSSFPFCVMFGVGLGYQLGYLYEQCTPKTAFIFEPDTDLFFASLFCFDWRSLLEHIYSNKLGLHIFIGQDESNIMNDAIIALNKRGAFLASNFFAFWHYPSPQIYKLMERVATEFYALSTGWGFFDDNILAIAHSTKNIAMKIPFLLKDKKISPEMVNIPIFVIGNGPSLDDALPYIVKNKEKAILIACGSAISALHNKGIKPDICVAIERTKSVVDFFELLNDVEYLQDILFFSSDVIHPDCHKYFSRSCLGFKPNEPSYLLGLSNFSAFNQYEVLNFTNPLVGNIGMCFPITIGFKNIYMFGLDNGYKEKTHHHSKHSAYYDKNGEPIAELTKVVTSTGGFKLPGNFGGWVIADRFFSSSARIMENLLKLNNVSCYNCSDGVYVAGASPLKLEDLEIENNIINKSETINYIYNNLFSPVNVAVSEFKSKLSVNVFIEVVNSLIKQWNEPLLSREDALERMQQGYEYLSATSNYYPHIYRVLVGSLNYLYTFLSTMAYRFENDEMTIKLMGEAVKIVIDYFEEAKKIYPHAFESIDDVDCEIMKLYRKN